MAKMAASLVAESGEDVFRKMFKFYRRREPPPDLKEVTDFSSGAASGGKIVPLKLDPAAVSDEEAACVGLHPIRDWRAFGLQGYPGFIFISNPFLRGSHAFWVRQCLKTYPQKPNVCNLDMHMTPCDTQDIWARSAQALRSPPSEKRQPKTLLERLRWVTLGYQYNWDTKTYSANSYTPFPPDLHMLSSRITAACGFPGFSSEAAILNYYRSDSSLGIHVDESEFDHSRPLLSLSFGQSAIFLLGGPKDKTPHCYVHAQRRCDVDVRTKPAAVSRRPADSPGTAAACSVLDELSCCCALPTANVLEPVSQEDWDVCSRYIQSSRVNMTVRQVLGPGQSFPEKPSSAHQTDDKGRTVGYHDDENSGKRKRTCSDPVGTVET